METTLTISSDTADEYMMFAIVNQVHKALREGLSNGKPQDFKVTVTGTTKFLTKAEKKSKDRAQRATITIDVTEPAE